MQKFILSHDLVVATVPYQGTDMYFHMRSDALANRYNVDSEFEFSQSDCLSILHAVSLLGHSLHVGTDPGYRYQSHVKTGALKGIFCSVLFFFASFFLPW